MQYEPQWPLPPPQSPFMPYPQTDPCPMLARMYASPFTGVPPYTRPAPAGGGAHESAQNDAAQAAAAAQATREALEAALRRAGPLLGQAVIALPLLDPLVAELEGARAACNAALADCAPPAPPQAARRAAPRATAPGCRACAGKHEAHTCGKARKAGDKAPKVPKPRPVEDLIFESLPDDMAKRTFSRVRDVDGEEVTETYFGIGWQPSAAELAEHALPAGPRKSAKVELTKHTYPYVCAFAKKEGMTLSGRAHGQATGEEGDETWSHNHYLQQVIARPRLAPSAPSNTHLASLRL